MTLTAYLKYLSVEWSLQWWTELSAKKETGDVPQEVTQKDRAGNVLPVGGCLPSRRKEWCGAVRGGAGVEEGGGGDKGSKSRRGDFEGGFEGERWVKGDFALTNGGRREFARPSCFEATLPESFQPHW